LELKEEFKRTGEKKNSAAGFLKGDSKYFCLRKKKMAFQGRTGNQKPAWARPPALAGKENKVEKSGKECRKLNVVV